MKKPPVNKIPSSKQGYRFQEEDKDPEMYLILYLIKATGWTLRKLSDKSGLNYQTLKKWDEGKTKKPATSSVRMVLKTIGVDRKFYIGNEELKIPVDIMKLFR